MARMLSEYWHTALLRTMQKHSDAPDRFFTWASFAMLGAAMKRRFYYKSGTYTIYPNQFIILVSPPGIGKGTAINAIQDITDRVGPVLNVVKDRVTAPKIIQRIADGWNLPPSFVGQQLAVGKKEHACLILSTELSMLVTASDNMLDFLCEGWDRHRYDYDTKNSGSSFITDMCLSLLGATVPDFIQNIDKNRAMSIRGGFTSRCLFIFEDSPSRTLLHPPPIDVASPEVQALENDLRHITQLPGGEYKSTPQARNVYDRFILAEKSTLKDDTDAVQYFKSRMEAHILKLAMVLSASRHDRLLIEERDMMEAICHIKIVLTNIERVFRGSGDSDIAVAASHVHNYVERKGAVSKRDILRHLYRHIDPDTLDRVLYTMTEIGVFKTVTSGRVTLYQLFNHTAQSPNGKVKP